ncbi:MAG: DEAD/DEAH box helicase [Sandaracinaceae bacterium]|nr:MAG: DEAD/DEAH box helicase [Sandaracinaceae bacterium]
MPRYRFSWDAFADGVVEAFADSLGYDPDELDETPRAFLEREVKRPNSTFVKHHKDVILEAWVARHEGTARYLYQRLADIGVGPPDYRPRSLNGFLKFLADTRNAKNFRTIVADAMIAYGDRDRPPDDDSPPDFVPRFGVLEVGSAPEDSRQPHDYQREAWDRMGAHLAEAEAEGVFQGLLVMPTGAGKTFTAVRWLTENVLARGGRVLWLAHRRELLLHAAAEFHRTAAHASPRERLRIRVVSGSDAPSSSIDPEDDVVIASVASLARRADIRSECISDPRTFVVIDEAHHSPAKSYRDLLRELADQRKFRVLGLTATPTRTLEDERPVLGRLFGHRILYQVGLRTLIERGTLSRPRIVRVRTGADAEQGITEADRKHFSRFGELSEEWLDRIAHLSDRNQAIVEHYLEHREKYGPTLVFAINIHHAALLAAELQEHGVRADYVASRRPDGTSGDPSALIEAFRVGELDVLVNVQMVTEGVDVPAIQSVFLARPTSSEILLRQMLGRALRGPAAGGTQDAYLVSFEDHWERYTDWESPFDLVPDLQIEAMQEEAEPEQGEPAEPAFRPELVEALPWDMVMTTARELRKLRAISPSIAFEAVPHGWYVFEHEGAEDHESFRHVVPFYAHQAPCWEHAFDRLWGVTPRTAGGYDPSSLEDSFVDCDDPRPAARDVEMAIRLRARGGDRPEPIAFAERERSDPRALAARILETDVGSRARMELIETAYDKLAQAVYPTLSDFRRAVSDAEHALCHPGDAQHMPKAVPLFELGDDTMLAPGPHHDLAALLDEMRPVAARLLEISAIPHRGPVEWTRRVVKGWYGMAYWESVAAPGQGRIRVNKMLDSPDVPEDVLRWLLWHEYLHLHLQDGHSNTFRALERRWPGFREAERFLTTLNNRFGIQAW